MSKFKTWFDAQNKPVKLLVVAFALFIVLGVLSSLSGCTKPGMVQDIAPHHEGSK